MECSNPVKAPQIPIVNILTMTPSKYGGTLVWGSFWVLNYEQRGDTLYCVSGGKTSGTGTLENKRAEMTGDYVKANRLSITKYQDYDWEPKSI